MIELIFQHWEWFFAICFAIYAHQKIENEIVKAKQPILGLIACIIIGVFWPFSLVILTLTKIFG